MKKLSLAILALSLASALPAHSDEAMTSFHYMDLYNIEHSVSGLKDLKRIRVDMYVTSLTPDVMPKDIKMTMHRASGSEETIQYDDYGHLLLPELEQLKAENPLITTNQPKHTLNASVVIDLAPLPPGLELDYSDLMLGVTQLNDAVSRPGNSAMVGLHGAQANGLLLFYNYGGHSLTVHHTKGAQVIKGISPEEAKAHTKGFQTGTFMLGSEVIYLPLDKKLLKENPRVTLDAPPAQTFPAY